VPTAKSSLVFSTPLPRPGIKAEFVVGHGLVVLVAGAIQCFAGYFSTWAAVTGLIPRPPVAAMCLFVFVAAHAQSFFNTADVVTSVRNFRHFSDTAVGIMKVSYN
jgi:hypothetical protein